MTGATGYVNDGLNRVTSVGGSSVTYDANQNIASALGDGFAYDAANRLTSTTIGGAADGFGYDPVDRLYSTSASGRRFQYAGQQLVGEYDASGTLLARHVPGPGLDAPAASLFPGGARHQQVADERGSVIALIDGAGALAALNRYDEYGVPAPGNAGRFGYTGQAWLPEAGVYHYRARVYHPQIGRFVQPDPIGYAAGMNLYGYVRGDPVNFTDPLGLQAASQVEDIDVNGRSCAERGGKMNAQGECKMPVYSGFNPAIFGSGPGFSPGLGGGDDYQGPPTEVEEVVVVGRRPRPRRESPIQPVLTARYGYLQNQIRRYNPDFSTVRAPGPPTSAEVRALERQLSIYRRIYFKSNHYNRRLERAGINVQAAERAVRISIAEGRGLSGSVSVSGQIVNYRAFQYQGLVNVGTIHIPW